MMKMNARRGVAWAAVAAGVASGGAAGRAGAWSVEPPGAGATKEMAPVELTRFFEAVARGELPAVFTRMPGAEYDGAGWGMVRVGAAMARPAGLGAEVVWKGGLFSSGVNDHSEAHYFYPASTVKLFAAVAAVEKLNELERAHGLGIGLDSGLRIGPVRAGELWRERDETNVGGAGVGAGGGAGAGLITVRHEIHKLFVVSDNEAFNRLYDFVGPEWLNERIGAWGLERTWVTHRLAGSYSAEENAGAPEVVVRGERGEVRLAARRWDSMPKGAEREARCATGLVCGEAVMRGGERVAGPIDFTERNRTTLADLQRVLMGLVEPAAISGPRFDLTAEQRAFLLEAARMLPRESAAPVYEAGEYPDDHVKFLLPGLVRVRPAAEWQVVNKIGLAYGYVTENAWVQHVPTGRGLFVAAVIHRNPDGVFNDDAYDYETTLAEMAGLGEVVGRALVGTRADAGGEGGAGAGAGAGAGRP